MTTKHPGKTHEIRITNVTLDLGGSHERASDLNMALQEAEAELGGAA